MPPERVVVSAEEVSQVLPAADAVAPAAAPSYARLKSPVPLGARIGMSALVLVLPVLAIVALILRIAFRNQPPSVRHAWTSFMSTLLIVSGLLSTAAALVTVSLGPVPTIVNAGLPDLDERHLYPELPAKKVLSSSDVSEQLKPLVVVVSPATRTWNHQEIASPEFGAGALLFADKTGYLFATANHVVSHGYSAGTVPESAMIATASGVWSSARVIATAPQLDLALLWVGRHGGEGDFVQPVVADRDGEEVFVIGHPEGLKFTLSTGIVSRIRDELVQVSAAISPGNSGGPVYDDHGNLIGIVSAKFDHNVDPNAENIGFATRGDALLDGTRWKFAGDGKKFWQRYTAVLEAQHKAVAASDVPEQ